MSILIKNANIVNEGLIRTSDMLVRDGLIAEIGVGINCPDAETIDANGQYLIPGIIDTHVHFRDAGAQENPAANFETESRKALLGGVTSVIDMPNTTPQTTSIQLLENKEQCASNHSWVNYGFMLGATNQNIPELLSISSSRFAAIKLFLGSSTGNMLVNDAALLDKLFAESNKLIVAHCEEEAIVAANLRNYKMEFAGTPNENADLHPKIRSTEACYISSYKAIERARKYHTRFHLAHVSSATELDLLSNMDLDQKHITAEVTPNHLWFDDRDYAELGNLIKCNPSIKSNNDRMALWAALYDGRIDSIGSDHAPHSWANKQKRYFDAPSGIPSIQYTLAMMLETFFNPSTPEDERQELINTWLPLLVTKMCHNPATIFGIEGRGFLRPGYAADLVLVGPNEKGLTIPQNPDSSCNDPAAPWTPLAGKTFHTKIDKVFVNGAITFDAREPQILFRNAQKLSFSK